MKYADQPKGEIMVQRIVGLAVIAIGLIPVVDVDAQVNQGERILQPLGSTVAESESGMYVPSTSETVQWGVLPNRDTAPLVTVSSGAVVTFDTVSHEGILEDQGRDPVTYFRQHRREKQPLRRSD